MSEPTPQPANGHAPAPDDGVYVISVAVQITGVPAATLRLYEDRGLLTPARTEGRTRRYSPRDIARIHRIAELSAAGINLAGIGLILDLQDHTSDLPAELHQANAGNHEPGGQRDPDPAQPAG